MDTVSISVIVNGKQINCDVEPRLLLSDFLRQDLRLTGTHVGCEHGICGACTVLLNGKSARSCLTFAVMTDGAEITTIEGHAENGKMSPLQEAFWENHGLQCGYCTPGMLATAQELLNNNPTPTAEEIREVLSGNLCRCTGYQTIVDAIQDAAKTIRGEAK